MTEVTVAERASSSLPTLSKAERRVGRALLADYPSAGLASAARLAERAEVSPPTVLRFAQSLGYDGFTDLQVGEPVVAEGLREPQHRRRADLGAFGQPGGAGQTRARVVGEQRPADPALCLAQRRQG